MLLLLIGGFVAYKMYNKPHVDVANAAADISLKAVSVVAEFTSDETAANKKYLDKVVQVSGEIVSITSENETTIIALQGNDFGNVLCYLSASAKATVNTLQEGEQVVVKGICTGFLLDVVLVKCELTP